MQKTVYLDTCIISRISQPESENSVKEKKATKELLNLHNKKNIILVTSEIAREELNKIPVEYKDKHLKTYDILDKVQTITAIKPAMFNSYMLNAVPFNFGGNSLYNELMCNKDKRIQEEDIMHLVHYKENKIDIFCTRDRKLIWIIKNKNFHDFFIGQPSECIQYLNM